MAWRSAFGRLLIEQRQLPSLRINAEGAHRPAGFALETVELAYGIKKTVIGMNREEAGVFGLGGKLRFRELARFAIEMRQIDAFAFLASVGADVNQIGFRCRLDCRKRS